MQDVNELKIIGIDSKRPPFIRKEPYIDLVFELSEKTTKQWCEDFMVLFKGATYKPKIDPANGIYIETWTRTMGEISGHLETLKTKVLECNQIARDRQAALDLLAMSGNDMDVGDEGPQGELNAIIANLDFD